MLARFKKTLIFDEFPEWNLVKKPQVNNRIRLMYGLGPHSPLLRSTMLPPNLWRCAPAPWPGRGFRHCGAWLASTKTFEKIVLQWNGALKISAMTENFEKSTPGLQILASQFVGKKPPRSPMSITPETLQPFWRRWAASSANLSVWLRPFNKDLQKNILGKYLRWKQDSK